MEPCPIGDVGVDEETEGKFEWFDDIVEDDDDDEDDDDIVAVAIFAMVSDCDCCDPIGP
jgi:hypothetical protein